MEEWHGGGEGELVEPHMAGSENAARNGVIAAIAAMIRWIAEENTRQGAVVELMACGGGSIGVAETPKHPEGGVIRWNPEE